MRLHMYINFCVNILVCYFLSWLIIILIIIFQGYMQWLYDHTGRRYLDLFAGIVTVSVGHCHPYVYMYIYICITS